MGNTTKKTTAYDETTKMQKELIALLLKKAGLKEKDVTEIALRRWALKNLDLLTAAGARLAEPGEFTYDSSTEPSIFGGGLSGAIQKTFEIIGKRFTYGGAPAMDQRVYYFNTKELIDNKFGTPAPIPFRVVDSNIGLDIDVSVRCNGVYSYRIAGLRQCLRKCTDLLYPRTDRYPAPFRVYQRSAAGLRQDFRDGDPAQRPARPCDAAVRCHERGADPEMVESPRT